jgi:hypothetical protein
MHITTSLCDDLHGMPSLCGSAWATREWFRALPARSFPACRPLRPRGAARCMCPLPSRDALAFADSAAAQHSQRWQISGLTGSPLLRPTRLLASLLETFTPELSTGWSPSPLSGMSTVATGQFPPGDFHPQDRQLATLHAEQSLNARGADHGRV